MSWNLEEAISYYQTQGAPQNQTVLINLLREIQTECGGAIPSYTLNSISAVYGIKESFLQAVIKRIPSLRLENTHCLELCAGPNCGKHKALAACAQELSAGGKFLRTGCQRLVLAAVRACAQLQTVGVFQSQAGDALNDSLQKTFLDPIDSGDGIQCIGGDCTAAFRLNFP